MLSLLTADHTAGEARTKAGNDPNTHFIKKKNLYFLKKNYNFGIQMLFSSLFNMTEAELQTFLAPQQDG